MTTGLVTLSARLKECQAWSLDLFFRASAGFRGACAKMPAKGAVKGPDIGEPAEIGDLLVAGARIRPQHIPRARQPGGGDGLGDAVLMLRKEPVKSRPRAAYGKGDVVSIQARLE